jgi:FkbM family methyltransferase
MKSTLARAANRLYDHAPRLYAGLYGIYKQWSDREERRLLARLIRPGMTVLDVGANIGLYTRWLAGLVGPDGRVIAMEPEPRNFERLTAAAARLPQVTTIHAAAAERSGTLRLYVADDLNVDHHSYDDGDGRRTVDVPAKAIDDVVPPGTRVDVIKMDIQGAELAALRGARRVLAENPDISMVLEYWPYGLNRAGASARELVDFLANCGFRHELVGGGDPAEVGVGESRYANLFAARPRTSREISR